MKDERISVNSVVQINHNHGDPAEPGSRNGWIGAFVLVTEVKSWGVQGFVQMIQAHDKRGEAFIRLNWNDIDYIGEAVLVPNREDIEACNHSAAHAAGEM